MTSLSSMLSYPLLLVLFLALSQESHGQLDIKGMFGDVLDFVPDTCMDLLETDIVTCVITKGCFSLFPTEEEFDSIPSEDTIQSCVDVETALCPITSRCPECREPANEFFKCIIFNNEAGLSGETTALVSSCDLDCTLVVTDAPVVAPTEAPFEEPSSVPVASPVAEPEEETEGSQSAESGAMNMMVSSVAIISAVTSFVLGW